MSDVFDDVIKDGGLSDYPIHYKSRCRRCNRAIEGTHARSMCGRCTIKANDHREKINRAAKRELSGDELHDEMKLDKKYHMFTP